MSEHRPEQIEHPGLTGDMAEQPDHGENSYRGSGRLTDRRALITGGDSGIGRAVALAFAREGADVMISFLPEEQEDAEQTLALIRAAGREGIGVPGDITEGAHCEELVQRARAEWGGLDILVNNAAYQMYQPDGIGAVTDEQFDRVMRTNLYGMFRLTRTALPWIESGGSIINTSSIQATQPSPELIDYAMTKAAIENFTKSLATQLVDDGIRVNCVAPGPIWTPLIPATMPPGKVENHGDSAPMERAGQPAELAPAFVFLASADASYITGEVIAVNGGTPTS